MKGNVADKFRAQLKLTETELRQALAGTIGAKEYQEIIHRKGWLG